MFSYSKNDSPYNLRRSKLKEILFFQGRGLLTQPCSQNLWFDGHTDNLPGAVSEFPVRLQPRHYMVFERHNAAPINRGLLITD
ncbi:MAG: hypothetical protein D8M51_09150 [Ignavibacteriae bacterium]|nr:hypothetical protein [Ignavibacteriota bacterium]